MRYSCIMIRAGFFRNVSLFVRYIDALCLWYQDTETNSDTSLTLLILSDTLCIGVYPRYVQEKPRIRTGKPTFASPTVAGHALFVRRHRRGASR